MKKIYKVFIFYLIFMVVVMMGFYQETKKRNDKEITTKEVKKIHSENDRLSDKLRYSNLHYPIEDGAVLTADFLDPEYKKMIGFDHSGIDLSRAIGSKIFAVTNGVIVGEKSSCDPVGGYIGNHCNNYLILRSKFDNDYFYFYYYHLANVYKKVGDFVIQGEVIATEGNSGYSTGHHLHFEVHKGSIHTIPNLGINDSVYNPFQFIKRR